LNWKALYSQAGQQRPDEIHVNIDNLIQDSIEHIKLDGDGSERKWEHNLDHEVSLVVDLDYLLPLGSALWKFQSGGLIRDKWRDNQSVTYTFKPVDLNQSFERLDEINWTVKTGQGSVGPLTYAASELIGAAYLQANYEKESWKLIGGIRTEYTDQGYHMFHPKAGESADGNQRYLDIFPNIQAKYTPQENVNWRLSYYRSINRPGFFELVPYTIEGEDYTEYGNKNLKRTRIDNLDLRWEVYPTPVNQLLIGLFFKQIYSPIEEAYSSINQRQSGYQLQNLGDARNIGLEIDAIRFIGILGVKANYTYTHSTITTPKVYYGRDENGDIETLTTNQTRPLVNQAAHIANLSLICKDVEKGWDGQVSATYIGDRILIASRYLNSDYWQKGAFTLDASFEKTFKNGWSLFAKASNLLNTPSILYQKVHNPANDNYALQDASSGETLIRKSYTYTTFLTGISYKF
jgi:TonB-dependent receptor